LKKYKYKLLVGLIALVVMSTYIFITTWQSTTYKEVHTMYPLEKSKNPQASEEFLKAMEYRIYIKELHPFFDYDSFIMAPLLEKLDYHFQRGKALLPKDSVEDIVWWTLFYKEIYGLLVPPRNDNSLAYENLPYQEFGKVHDEVYEMIMRYPDGEVYFKIDEIKSFRFKAMAILVEFYYGKYSRKYNSKIQKEKAQEYANDLVSKQRLKKVLQYYIITKKKYLDISSHYKKMYLHYVSDIVSISSSIVLKEIYQDKNLQLQKKICHSQEAIIIQKYTQLLLDSLQINNHQTKIIFTDVFDVEHTNNVAMFMMLANKCHNLNPAMKEIAKKVYKLNNIKK